MLCLQVNDLYGGKICAALDRQHPRDFFDLYHFFKTNSYTRELHETFMVYLLSSNRPISELINPSFQDLRSPFKNLFSGMTPLEIRCEDLENIREEIFSTVHSSFTDRDKEFLLSFKRGEPKWELFPIQKAQEFPAVKWKLYNIKAMNSAKRRKAFELLEKKLTLKSQLP